MIRRHNRVVQFVGAETAQGILPVLETLRAGNKGAIITYGVEVDRNNPAGNASGGKESARKRVVKEIIASIDVAADFENGREPSGSRELGRRAFVAVKLVSRRTMSRCIILTVLQTGMLPDCQPLLNFSTYLTHTRAPLEPPVPFPGTPSSSDLSVLHSSIPTGALTESDIHDLKELYKDLVHICTHAADRGVRVMLDAEHRCVANC